MLLTYSPLKMYTNTPFHSKDPNFFPYIAHHVVANLLPQDVNTGKKLMAYA